MTSFGSGPGTITPDGCAVEVYAALPPAGEPDLIGSVLRPGATILELGSGAGRVTHPLLALGFAVVAVDESAEMLAHVVGTETVRSPIAGLRLGRTFDAVLMGSHLVNVPDDRHRALLFDCARRHVAADGVVLVEWHPPAWFESVRDGAGGTVGEFRIDIGGITRVGDLLTATVRYRRASQLWTQTFTARQLSEAALHRDLGAANLVFDRYLTDDRGWFAALPREASGGDRADVPVIGAATPAEHG